MLENLDLSRTNVTQNIFESLQGIVTEYGKLITLAQPFNGLSWGLHERVDDYREVSRSVNQSINQEIFNVAKIAISHY